MIARRFLAALALTLAVPATGASAASITQEFTFGSVLGAEAAPFDPRLGTLTSVDFFISTSVVYDWRASGPGDVDFILDLNLSAGLADAEGFIDTFTDVATAFVFVSLGEDDVLGSSVFLIARTGGSYSEPRILSRFLGDSGAPYLDADSDVFLDDFGSAASFSGEFGPITGNARLTYNYTSDVLPVPEPASWVLMIAGFGLVGGVLRRRPAVTLAPA